MRCRHVGVCRWCLLVVGRSSRGSSGTLVHVGVVGRGAGPCSAPPRTGCCPPRWGGRGWRRRRPADGRCRARWCWWSCEHNTQQNPIFPGSLKYLEKQRLAEIQTAQLACFTPSGPACVTGPPLLAPRSPLVCCLQVKHTLAYAATPTHSHALPRTATPTHCQAHCSTCQNSSMRCRHHRAHFGCHSFLSCLRLLFAGLHFAAPTPCKLKSSQPAPAHHSLADNVHVVSPSPQPTTHLLTM